MYVQRPEGERNGSRALLGHGRGTEASLWVARELNEIIKVSGKTFNYWKECKDRSNALCI